MENWIQNLKFIQDCGPSVLTTMTSRDRILEAIQKNKPDLHPLPTKATFESNYPDRVAKFSEILRFIGGTPVVVESLEEAETYLRQTYSDLTRVVSLAPGLQHLTTVSSEIDDPHEFASVDLAVVPGAFGVAENAAVWVPEEATGHRVLPFICQHLTLVVQTTDLVENMHRAYERLPVGASGFGVFIAGPSKTADIEQSLVIGAHGARSLSVILLKKS